ncbi:MAG: cysteine--tRNA ligase [Acidobacteria bacterium RIFCSPLOWO2_02_FULL_68_18]|nr:MAG: cysteine--tRNA ligase [Acidobacteria bacterium RIFCSPLOWO2_02_FULL_68_18]OFW50023.1 MAG: cysteine--tRNA ligase [Acidobacteria bacterium RIFCSPLOWO2_12_FULL_68_19]
MLRLYNTLTRREEPFAPAQGNTIRMYACGPTVYARAHIGNFRTFVCVDVLRRTLKHVCGHEVRQAVNYTDVDDKTIAGAQQAGVPLRAFTDGWIQAFREDAAALGLETPEETPRATDDANLRAMSDLVLALERNGHTYRRDGSIYFRISTLPAYGTLARLDREGMQDGARVDVDEYTKDDPRDFVLWKGERPGEPSWDFGTGPGRPGWHIECSAMALRLLGEPPIDIHAGGVDLIFPHHENEIAQSEGATGKPFARVWVHVEHLFVEHEKMSKSLGNVYTLADVAARGHRRSALRYLLLSAHYRTQLNFTWTGMDQAEEALRRIVDCLARLDEVPPGDAHVPVLEAVAAARQAFQSALEDDVNTAAALAAVFDLVRDVNAAIDARTVSATDAGVVRRAIEDFDRVLGVVGLRQAEDARPPMPVEEIERIVQARQAARQRRDFAAADRIRRELAERGILLEDNPGGTRWKKK